MADNPIMKPMSTLLAKSVEAAPWLKDSTEYGAAVALARSIAGQIDDIVAAGGSDLETLKQLHMRMIPNYQRALFTLGLTPEGYAKMTGVGSVSRSSKAAEDEDDDPASAPVGVATPFAASAGADVVASNGPRDPLDALIIDMDSRR